MTKETNENVRKISNSLSGKPSWNLGLTKETDERVMNISISLTGKKQPNVSAAKQGKKQPNLAGNKNPAWKGGISQNDYSTEWANTLKEIIRNRDNYQCQECKRNQEEFNYKLHVHHINYDKKNCDKENLISLCLNCHPKTTFNMQYWQERFQTIILSRIK